MREWLARLGILNRTETRKNCDAQIQRFITELIPKMGVEMEFRNLYGEFDDDVYRQFQASAGVALPPDFEAYLRAFNGGLPSNINHPFGFLFSMQNQEREASLLAALSWELPVGNRKWLTFGRDGAMGLYFMSLDGDDFGSIYTCFAWSDEGQPGIEFGGEPRELAECFAEMFKGA